MNADEIRAALAAATPGPWDAKPLGSEGYAVTGAPDPDALGVRAKMRRRIARFGYQDWDADRANAELVANAPTWLAELLAEVDRLTRWKTEMITVLHGLQDLGKVLGLPLGEQITGETAAEAAHALRARAEAAEQAVQRVREFAEQGREFADRTMDDAAAHWARSAADGIIRALDGR